MGKLELQSNGFEALEYTRIRNDTSEVIRLRNGKIYIKEKSGEEVEMLKKDTLYKEENISVKEEKKLKMEEKKQVMDRIETDVGGVKWFLWVVIGVSVLAFLGYKLKELKPF